MKFFKIILIVLITIAFFFLGYFRSELNEFFHIWKQSNISFSSAKYPLTIKGIYQGLIKNSVWILNINFSLIYGMLSAFLAWIVFPNKNYTLLLFFLYAGLMIITVIFILLSIIFDYYAIGYGIAQKIKFFLQSPLPVMIILVIFRKKIKI